jgi:hypothetical protein
MAKHLDSYVEKDERLVDIVMETLVPNLDFRWLILTDIRIIRVIYQWFEYRFYDVRFEGIDMQISEGFFYDSVHIKSMTDDYVAHFYTLSRPKTRRFLQEIEDERVKFTYNQSKESAKVQHQVLEDLIVEGELPIDQDSGHKKKLSKARKVLRKKEIQTPIPMEDAIKAIGEIDEQKYEGKITPEEYEEKKGIIVGRIRKTR